MLTSIDDLMKRRDNIEDGTVRRRQNMIHRIADQTNTVAGIIGGVTGGAPDRRHRHLRRCSMADRMLMRERNDVEELW